MRNRFDDEDGPDLKVVVGQYRDVVGKRLKWLGPILGGVAVLLIVLSGVYSVNPGEVGVVRTFGQETGQSQPGLHFVLPIFQSVDIVDLAKIRRTEVGFRTTQNGTKRIDSEALMLTGDENIIEAMMIVQYQVRDPSKYLFNLKDPETSLHVAAEVALREVAGQMRITSAVEDVPIPLKALPHVVVDDAGDDEADDATEKDETDDKKDAADEDPPPPPPPPPAVPEPETSPREVYDPETDILTTGRVRAQVNTKEMLQALMDLYESGLQITEVKFQDVVAPDEVKDAFHDVVRAREEREQTINKALGYREDQIPRANGEAEKIIRAAEAYKQERQLRAEGEANRYRAILAEYRKAKPVTRERLYLETMERILMRVPKKVFIDKDVAKNTLPFLPLPGTNTLPPANQGGGR